jgi:hypothetical protein
MPSNVLLCLHNYLHNTTNYVCLIFSGEKAAVHVLRGDPGCLRMEVFLKSFTALRGYELHIPRGNPGLLVLDMPWKNETCCTWMEIVVFTEPTVANGGKSNEFSNPNP